MKKLNKLQHTLPGPDKLRKLHKLRNLQNLIQHINCNTSEGLENLRRYLIMSDPYTRNEQKEFLARLESERDRLNDENKRQNSRLEKLEKAFDKLEQLALSVNTLMHNVNNLADEIKAQSAKLKHIEEKGAKRWEEVVTQIIKLLVATVTGYILARIGLQS